MIDINADNWSIKSLLKYDSKDTGVRQSTSTFIQEPVFIIE